MDIIKNFKSIESFETENLISAKLTTTDFKLFSRIPRDSRIPSSELHKKNTDENFHLHLKRWVENGFGMWLFYKKNTHECVGQGCLNLVSINSHTELEIICDFIYPFSQKKYTSEIINACTEVAFEVLRFKSVIRIILPIDQPSQTLIEKIGFNFESSITLSYDDSEISYFLYRKKSYRKAEVIPYDMAWPSLYHIESEKIAAVLGDILNEIHHIGSTAIVGMPAKPIIDILLECENINQIEYLKNNLFLLGYRYFSRQIIPYRSYFTRKQSGATSYHLHIYEQGDPQVKRHINFRDYMIHHPIDAKNYANLKLSLADKFLNDLHNYVLGKDAFVQEIDRKAKLWAGRRRDFLLPTRLNQNNLSSEIVVKTVVANFNVYMTYFAQYLKQIELTRIPGYTLVNSMLNSNAINYVLDIDFTEAQANEKINEILNIFTEKHLPFSLWISPYDKPENLENHLEQHHFSNKRDMIAMLIDLNTWEPTTNEAAPVKIFKADNKHLLQNFVKVFTQDSAVRTFYFSWIAEILSEEDPIHFHVGFVNEKPIVSAITCYYAGIMGLYGLSTSPEAQNEGYNSVMREYCLAHAKKQGYHAAVIHISKAEYPFYKKLGYQHCCTFTEFTYETK